MKKLFGSEKLVIGKYVNGSSIDDIAADFGVSNTVIQRILREANVQKRCFGEGRRIDLSVRTKAIELYQGGQSLIAVGKSLGIDFSSVRNILIESGLPIRPKKVIGKSLQDNVVRLYEQKVSTTDISDVLGIAQSSVCNVLKRMGVEARPSSTACKVKTPIEYEDRLGRIVVLKSSYELYFAQFLDALCIDWAYESVSFDLGVVGKRRWTYTPDFYLKECDVHVDVKGYQWSKQVKRISRFRESYPHVGFAILGETQLTALGINCKRRLKWHERKARIKFSPPGEQLPGANPVNSVKTLQVMLRAIPSQAAETRKV